MKKTLLFILLFCLTVVPETWGQESWQNHKEDGWAANYDSENHFEITTEAELAQLAYLVNEGKDFSGKTVVLTTGLNLSAYEWVPIGTGYIRSFKGVFDGSNHTVSGLFINQPDKYYIALFGYVFGGSISNLGIEADPRGLIGYDYVGVLAAYCEATITNCWASGDVTVNRHNSFGGGLIAYSYSIITNCYALGNVTATNAGAYLGGLVGYAGFSISDSYATGDIMSTAKDSHIGGLVGYTDNSITNCYATGKITAYGTNVLAGGLLGGSSQFKAVQNCYATGMVEGDGDGSCLGGLIGKMGKAVENCYATGEVKGTQNTYKGALIGSIVSGISPPQNCFYLQDGATNNGLWGIGATYNNPGYTALSGESSGTTPLTIDVFVKQVTFTDSGWDFGTVWTIGNRCSPYFQWQQNNFPVLDIRNDPVPSYTLTLELGENIRANYQPGELSVNEGDYLYLTFFTTGIDAPAADILFLLDGVETSFRELGGNYDYSFIITNIDSDHTILIALREYSVVVPPVDGAVTDPPAGTYNVRYGEPFTFILMVDGLQNPEDIRVYANEIELIPEDDLQTIQPDSLRYTISRITGAVDITIEGVNPTGNVRIGKADVQITMDNGQLTVDNEGNLAELAVYTLTGKLYTSRPLPTGTTTVILPQGIFIVRAGGTTVKVLVD